MKPFRSVQRVYFDDLDALNILHNVRYLLFIERARGELFNHLGFRWQDPLADNPDKFHVIASHHIDYLAPVQGEGDLFVDLQPTRIGNTSFEIAATVRSADETIVHATSSTRLVRLDDGTRRPCPWSARFRAAMAPWLDPAPA